MKTIQVMHFIAGNGDFDSFEINDMMKKLRAFQTVPFNYIVDGGMSDAVTLFTSEEVTNEQAQYIFNTILKTDIEEEPCLWEGQEMLLDWDGTTITVSGK